MSYIFKEGAIAHMTGERRYTLFHPDSPYRTFTCPVGTRVVFLNAESSGICAAKILSGPVPETIGMCIRLFETEFYAEGFRLVSSDVNTLGNFPKKEQEV
jgi:hypothetical protein